MALLTKEQVRQIILNAPPDTTPEGIISALREEGHELEGYDEAQLSPTQLSDQRSAQRYGAVFPYETGDRPLEAGIKTAGNLPSSLFNFLKSTGKAAVNVFNPNLEKNTVANLGNLLGSGVLKVVPGKQKGEELADAFGKSIKERYGGEKKPSRSPFK